MFWKRLELINERYAGAESYTPRGKGASEQRGLSNRAAESRERPVTVASWPRRSLTRTGAWRLPKPPVYTCRCQSPGIPGGSPFIQGHGRSDGDGQGPPTHRRAHVNTLSQLDPGPNNGASLFWSP
ncbi:hypothetical protein AAFF_G00146710 [Aldrovandia affinis]|uniref:Uncharacterized protein n=1 Tax=Aldrovandia affinis TaxID=143900 RepID=A0AAD7RQ13_9TELE|nr:hypothetical protein AAFF_G00146710 [Aldrovandia affinis]